MKNIDRIFITVGIVVMVLYCAIFFIAKGTEHTCAGWTAFVCAFVAFAYLLITPSMARNRKSTVAYDINRPVYAVSAVYFLCSLAVGIVFLFIPNEISFKWPLIINLVLLALTVIIDILQMKVNDNTAEKVENQEQELRFVKDASSALKAVMLDATDATARRKLEQTYDLLSCSQVKSSVEVSDLEQQIMDAIPIVVKAVENQDAEAIIDNCETICRKVNERNMKLKLLN